MEVVREKIQECLSSDMVKWFIAFRHPSDIYAKHSSYLIAEVFLYVLSLLTFRHALRSGGRFPFLWFATVLHGLVVESLSYVLPDIDNFWHAQSMVMLLGKRLPLHIVSLYPVFIYTAVAAVSRLHLSSLASACATGLAVVLLDAPFDVLGIKLLWWTWHDTDPNIADRMYWVPWNSYYFHAAFASSFSFLFFGSRSLLSSVTERFVSSGLCTEIVCLLVTGLLAMPLGVLQFIPIYHVLHDLYSVHTQVCVLLFLSLYFLLVWSHDRHAPTEARTLPNRGWFDEIALAVLLHYGLYVYLVVTEHPERVRSLGLHEPVGDCAAATTMVSALGHTLTKRTYLCAQNYDEGYYDFHCASGGRYPPNGTSWYTVCGTPWGNHTEYIVVVGTLCLAGVVVFLQLLRSSGRPVKTRAVKVVKQKRS